MNTNWNEVEERRLNRWVENNITTVEDLVLIGELMDHYPEDLEIKVDNFIFHRKRDELFIRGEDSGIQMGGENWISKLKDILKTVNIEELA